MQNACISQLNTSHRGLLQLPWAANMCQQSKHQRLSQPTPKIKHRESRTWACRQLLLSFLPCPFPMWFSGLAARPMPYHFNVRAIASPAISPYMVEIGKLALLHHSLYKFMLQINVVFLNGRDWKGGKMPSPYKNDCWNTDSSPMHILFPKPGYLKGRKKKER